MQVSLQDLKSFLFETFCTQSAAEKTQRSQRRTTGCKILQHRSLLQPAKSLTCHPEERRICARCCNECLKAVKKNCGFDDKNYRMINEVRRNKRFIVAMNAW